jgi:urease accessory protein
VSLGALLLSDSRFPAGGHAHSGGVEPASTAGTVTDLASLEVFLRGRLRTAGMVAAGLAAAACARARNAGAAVWEELDAEADARTPSPAQREASRRQGRALLRAARAAWPDARWLASLASSTTAAAAQATQSPPTSTATAPPTSTATATATKIVHATPSMSAAEATHAAPSMSAAEYRGGPHYAVVLGAAAAAAGCTPREAARIAAYQSVAGPASAAVRLLALDPMRAAAVLARLDKPITARADEAATYALGPLADLPFTSAPGLDLLAEAHIAAEVRLFES